MSTKSIEEQSAAVKACFASGKTRPLEWRLAQLHAMLKLLENEKKTITDAINRDLGHSYVTAYLTEISITVEETKFLIANLPKWIQPEKVPIPARNFPGSGYIVREPLGTILVVSPWNYPFSLCMIPLAGAIAGGNTAIIKPSEVSNHTSEVIAKLVAKYLDPEAFAVIQGGVPETQRLLAQHWDHIIYTGNGDVGKLVMESAAKHLTPVTLELGGKSPVYVDESCDVRITARRLVWGKFLNCGQTCVAPDYIMVHSKVYEPLIAAIKETIVRFYGSDAQQCRDYSRIISLRHTDRLASLIRDPSNGTLVVGGRVDRDKKFIEPTVFRDVPWNAKVMEGELFGPIMPLMSVSGVDEAIKLINSRPKPLALYVFTSNKSISDKVIANTSSGGVCVNETIMHVATETLPFGGVGPSGMGTYHGRHSFETFTHPKAVFDKPLWMDPSARYPPYPANMIDQLEKMMGIMAVVPKVAAGAALLGTALFIRARL